MMNHYARAIDALNSDKVSTTDLLYEIAKKNPKALADAFDRLMKPAAEVRQVKTQVTDWTIQSIQMMRDGNHVAAIKHCRLITGWGMKQAKEACDSIKPGAGRFGEE